jgi:transcriptional regulator with XRE-family HTH domain
MEIDEWAIGRRIASHRIRRDLTQEELAGLVGISLSMMKKIESGDRLVTRFSQLVLFAQVLRVKDLRELTGIPLPLMPDGRRGHPCAEAVRSAVLGRGHEVQPTTLDELRTRITRAWDTWQEPSAFRYDAVGQRLPQLISLAQASANGLHGAERRAALSLASAVYQLARTWTKRVGEYELSLLEAHRAVSCALEADDPDLAGAAAWNLAHLPRRLS